MYVIELSKKDGLSPKPTVAFDPHQDPPGRQTIPLVHPHFLGDDDTPSEPAVIVEEEQKSSAAKIVHQQRNGYCKTPSPPQAPQTPLTPQTNTQPQPPPSSNSLLLGLLNRNYQPADNTETGTSQEGITAGMHK